MRSQIKWVSDVFLSNGELYFCDTHNNRVRKVLRDGQTVTIAGTGQKNSSGDGKLATQAELTYPIGVVVSSLNEVFIAEQDAHRIRKIDRHGVISTFAGTGSEGYCGDGKPAVRAKLNRPCGLFVTQENEVYFCDAQNHRIRKIDSKGIISTVAGTGAIGFNGDNKPALKTNIEQPTSVFVQNGEVFFNDTENRIRKVLRDGTVQTIAGTGKVGFSGDGFVATKAEIDNPDGLFVFKDEVYFSDWQQSSQKGSH